MHFVFTLETLDLKFPKHFLQNISTDQKCLSQQQETQDNLCQGRGDAYCGMLNASYNLQLRNVKPISRNIRLVMPKTVQI